MPADLTLRLANGGRIETSGEEYLYGAEVTVYSPAGEACGHWTADEWRDDPEAVMGAILACAAFSDSVPASLPFAFDRDDEPCSECLGNGYVPVCPDELGRTGAELQVCESCRAWETLASDNEAAARFVENLCRGDAYAKRVARFLIRHGAPEAREDD